MYHHWNWITFLHRRYQPAVVQRLLPPGLTTETADGTAWIWFFSLGAPAVLAVRAGYPGWPYFWSGVSVRVSGDWLGYRCRRLPGHGARCNAEVTMGVPLAEAERDELGLDQDLLRRAGLPPSAGDPLAHASPEYRCGSACGTGDRALNPA
jgi:uncharacterized protein YqjF (DUF2071 family)